MKEDNKEEAVNTKMLIALMLFAYLFGIAVRFIWIDWASGIPEFYWNGQIMINTNDGYYFASAAQKELFGTLQHNPRVPDLWMTATITLTYFAAKILPVSLDTVILYMPGVVASLVAIPLVLIGRLYGVVWVGFFAALLASVTWSYYNRTMFGYYDTDMFSAMVPMFIVYLLLAANHRRSLGYALAASLLLALYPFLYNQGKAMVFAISALYVAYVWFRHRKEPFAYPSIILVSAALLPIPWPAKLLLLPLLYLLLLRLKDEGERLFYIAAAAAVLAFLTGDGFNFIYTKIMRYAQREGVEGGLHFYNVVNTIREAGHIPFDIFAKRIAGSVPGFFFALAGYALLLWRKPAFIVTLPLMGLGLFAWWGGLRFTVYAVPIASFGAIYLFYVAAGYISNLRFRTLLTGVAAAALLYPNIVHVVDYKTSTVFNSNEVKVLDTLKKSGSDKDYVIAWWDYGYPIWYYANKNTLIDGAKHSHDNFLVSQILLTDSQLEAARLSRVSVETYISSGYKTIADTLFKNGKPDQIDPNEYLKRLREESDISLPPKSREVYIYLPWRMYSILPTVALFSSIDLNTGERKREPLYVVTELSRQTKDRLVFANSIELDMKRSTLKFGKNEAPVRRFVTTSQLKEGGVDVKVQNLYSDGGLTILYAKSYGRFFIMDERMFRSTYIQLFFLENYDERLFEPVVFSAWAKVYRVKL